MGSLTEGQGRAYLSFGLDFNTQSAPLESFKSRLDVRLRAVRGSCSDFKRDGVCTSYVVRGSRVVFRFGKGDGVSTFLSVLASVVER